MGPLPEFGSMPGSGMGSPASGRRSGRVGSGTARMRSMASAVSDWSNSLDSPGSVAIFASVDAVEKWIGYNVLDSPMRDE